jgi:hypothetical protein
MANRHDSAPDLRILGDEITLQPSGFVGGEGKEEALMKNMARFRSEPLQCVAQHSIPRTPPLLDLCLRLLNAIHFIVLLGL